MIDVMYSSYSLSETIPCSLTASPMISPIGSLGERDEYGSWKMICILVRSSLRAFLSRVLISLPSNMISPSVFSRSLNIVLPVVDLPQPDSPTSPIVVPFLMVKETSSTALTCPVTPPKNPPLIGKYFLRFLTSKMFSEEALTFSVLIVLRLLPHICSSSLHG